MQAEEAVKGQGFARAGIFRPGMLDRGDKARSIEKVTVMSYRVTRFMPGNHYVL